MTWQDAAFVERIDRLNQGHARRSSMARGFDPSKPKARKQVPIGLAITVVTAAVIGALSVLISRYAMFLTQGTPSGGADPAVVMIVDALFAFCIAFVIRMTLNMSSRFHFSASVVGIFVALTSVHNLVHAYPEAWARAFSSEWVEHTKEQTAPKSLYIQGRSFEFTEIIPAHRSGTI